MFDSERARMLEEKKLFLGTIDYFETVHIMKMKDRLNAESCIPIQKGRIVWILDEIDQDKLINFVDSITCPKCKNDLKCPLCGGKMHTKEGIDQEISQIKMGIELCNARLQSDNDCYYDAFGELQKGEKILKHLQKIKSKIKDSYHTIYCLDCDKTDQVTDEERGDINDPKIKNCRYCGSRKIEY